MWTGKWMRSELKEREFALSDLLIESENFTVYYVRSNAYLTLLWRKTNFSYGRIKTGVGLTMSNRQPRRQHRKDTYYRSTTTWPECSWSSSGMRKRISKGECRTRYRATRSRKMNSTPLSKWFSTQKCFATVTACAKHFRGTSGSAQNSISAQMRCISATLST